VTRSRALQVCPNDHPPFLELCRGHAAALAAAGCDVDTVFLGAPRGRRWNAATYLGIDRGTRAMIGGLRRHCGSNAYRLVVMHRYRAYQVSTRARIDAADYVTVAHEYGMFERRRRRVRQRLLGRDVAFAGVSQAVVDEMRRLHPSLRRSFVLPNPVDVAAFDRARLTRADARSALGIADRAYAIGVVGRLHPEKRPLLALESFAGAALPAEAQLVFVGDGALRESLETRARALGVAARVRFAGHVVDAARHLAAFDVSLVTSGPTEAFGMSVLEAMVAGVPVVCADQAGPRSVLGPDGRYFAGGVPELTVELGRVAALSPTERERLCRAQRERAEREFALPAVAEIYRRLLNTGVLRPAGAS
jgi:glycosyltransferase involved in cell wall biosynthesis